MDTHKVIWNPSNSSFLVMQIGIPDDKTIFTGSAKKCVSFASDMNKFYDKSFKKHKA